MPTDLVVSCYRTRILEELMTRETKIIKPRTHNVPFHGTIRHSVLELIMRRVFRDSYSTEKHDRPRSTYCYCRCATRSCFLPPVQICRQISSAEKVKNNYTEPSLSLPRTSTRTSMIKLTTRGPSHNVNGEVCTKPTNKRQDFVCRISRTHTNSLSFWTAWLNTEFRQLLYTGSYTSYLVET